MRDAFGGVFTMNLLLVFIFIFVAFSAVSLNYAKAFKLKNDIIDFIETNEIIDLSSKTMEKKHLVVVSVDALVYEDLEYAKTLPKPSASGEFNIIRFYFLLFYLSFRKASF